MAIATVLDIPTDRVYAATNDRQRFGPRELDELARSLQRQGLLQPILVRGGPDRYELVAGERRLRAALALGWPTIAALVRPLDDAAASQAMLAENLQRVQLDPMEEARAYARRLGERTIAELAAEAGVSSGRVSSRLELMDLVPEAQELVSSSTLPLAHAASMRGLDPNRQRLALRAVVQSSRLPTAVEFRKACGTLLGEQLQETLFDDVATLFAVSEPEGTAPTNQDPLPLEVIPDPTLPPLIGGANVDETLRAYHARLLRDPNPAVRSAAGVVAHIWIGLRRSNMATPARRTGGI
ncbi:MAG TPA: ParB/RepB/Spo0J family partition protein [Verrucomicrobiae bacterium]|nr:ParB/RepB/Spo0J family partition protein [Verrucomicrobiae bacterium]